MATQVMGCLPDDIATRMFSSACDFRVWSHIVHCGLMLGIAVLATLIAAGTRNCADARSLAEVRQTGILRLCANPSALPYSNLTDRGGLAGFEVELAEALAHEMGLELGVTWVRNAGELKNSDCDVSMGAVASAVSYDREGLTGPLTTHLPLRFSRPYADSGVVLVVSSRSSVRRLNDLHGQKIGVMVGTIEHEWLAKRDFRVSVFASQEDIIAAIEAGDIEVGTTNPVTIGWYRHEHPSTAVRVPDGYEPELALRWGVSVGLRRADDALLAAVDTALAQLVEQRIPAQIYAKYGIPYLPSSGQGLQ
ncbi:MULTISPECIES: ABC transporter substrate-binding protein [Bradyrhizobium]|uniref:substrate-binding periplasmic protein n=1 Tax=Bradyrhizobium TaxID=374 RepID=UPI0012FDFA6B|nr:MULTISPECIES: transporter substrate-binding domain-containing protein [Bradyrhizobium]MCA1479635.1 amino acid ABC transporter substrate-binding protein [Bradyrhizobium sp. NBAIM08]